jgi:uncharacterized protein YegJ (DUF2314 family)
MSDTSDKFALVLLLDGMWELTPKILKDIILNHFDTEVTIGDGDSDGKSTEFAMGSFPTFFAQFEGFMFIIHTLPQPFFENPQAAAQELGELRVSKAVAEHTCHIHVSLMNAPAEADEETQRHMVGKMVVGLGWSDSTRAIFNPQTGMVRLWEETFKKALEEDGPDAAFNQFEPSSVKTEPVFKAELDDEDFKWVEAEAKRRWPEFEAAWANRQPGQLFLVKAPCKDGDNVEHMWIRVTKMEDGYVQGKLENEPVNVTRFKRGSTLRLKVSLITDWAFEKDKQLVGYFSTQALERKKQRAEAGIRQKKAGAAAAVMDIPAVQKAASPRDRNREDAGPRRREPVAKASSSKAVWWIAGIALGAVLLLSCAGVAFVVMGGMLVGFRGHSPEPDGWGPPPGNPGPGPGPGNPPPKVEGLKGEGSSDAAVRQFVGKVRGGDVPGAYELTSAALKQRQTVGQLQEFVTKHKAFDSNDGQMFFLLLRESPDEAVYVASVKNPKGTPAFTLVSKRDVGWWWVDNIERTDKVRGPAVQGAGNGPMTVQWFRSNLNDGNLVRAYSLTTDRFQKELPYPQFPAWAKKFAVLTTPRFDIITGADQSEVILRTPGLTAPPALTLRTQQFGKEWLIDSMTPGAKLPARGHADRGACGRFFRGALADGRLEEAYSMLSPDLQKKLSIEEFRTILTSKKQFDGVDAINVIVWPDPKDDSRNYISVTGPKGRPAFEFRVANVGGTWFVAELTAN